MPKIQAKAQAMGIAEHVRFLGVRSDVADLMQAIDVFIFAVRRTACDNGRSTDCRVAVLYFR